MKYFIILFVFCAIFTECVFAESLPENQAEELATAMGIVYVGMPKEALYQVYTPITQKGYRKIGCEEWIVFSDWTTEEPGDRVSFYLKDGYVRGWRQERQKNPARVDFTDGCTI